MKKYFLSVFLFLLFATQAFAANTSGYAWSESVGWFDFSNATISDTAVTGYAYNDNTGWLVLDGITNTDGTLSGYAWSESVGYFDFSNVIISSGVISGYAYNDNIGWLSFESGTSVTTTWEPIAPTPTTRRSSGSSISGRIRNLLTIGKKEEAKQLQIKFPNTPVILPTITPPSSPEIHKMLASNSRDLEQNAQGQDVKLLQQFLNQNGFFINTPGLPGSLGYETNYFGSLTKQALIKFQQSHTITPSLGYFGPKTRAFIATLSNN